MKTKFGDATVLDVPFDEKDYAKEHGARWAGDFRVWVWPNDKGPVPDELKDYLPKPSPWTESSKVESDGLLWGLKSGNKEYCLVLIRGSLDLWIFSRVGQLNEIERQPLLVKPFRHTGSLLRCSLSKEEFESKLDDAKKRDSVDRDPFGRESNTGRYVKKVQAERDDELDSVNKLVVERNEIQAECLKLVT